jgi:hypothetical protein
MGARLFFFTVRFDTVMFVLVVLNMHRETNQKQNENNIYFCFTKQTKQTTNPSKYISFD